MTRDEARAYFKEKGLTYADISRTDLGLLRTLLDLHFAIERSDLARTNKYPYWLRTHQSRDYKGKWAESGAMICAFLTAAGVEFCSREVVSFYKNGFIGLCENSSGRNAELVLIAFVEWCDAMAEYKAMKKEDEHERTVF